MISFNLTNAKIIKFTQSPRFNFELKSIYDNNIYLYSPDYITDYVNRVRSYRFPINSYDDFIVLLNPSFKIPFNLFGVKPDFFLNYKQYLYTVNADKSYQIFSLTISSTIMNRFSLSGEYLFMPRYLIRYYRNPLGPSTNYVGCTFSEQLLSFKLNYKWDIIKVQPFIRYEIDNYKKNFNFYDGTALRYGLDINLKPSRIVDVTLGIERKQYNAKGPLPDISYNDNIGSIEIDLKVPRFEKLSCLVGGEYTNRTFITNNSASIDPFHKDRKDIRYAINIGLSYNISSFLKLEGVFEREVRNVTIPLQVDIEDIKNYTKNRFSAGIKFSPSKVFRGD